MLPGIKSEFVEISGDILQFGVPDDIVSGEEMESIADLAVVYECVFRESDDVGIFSDWLIGSRPMRILFAL